MAKMSLEHFKKLSRLTTLDDEQAKEIMQNLTNIIYTILTKEITNERNHKSNHLLSCIK